MPPVEKLRHAVGQHIEIITRDLDFATVSLTEARALTPKQRQRIVAQRDHFDGLFRQITQEGIDAGAFRPVDVTLVSFALMGMHNWLILWYHEDGRLSAQRIAAIFADLVLNGLLTESERHEQ